MPHSLLFLVIAMKAEHIFSAGKKAEVLKHLRRTGWTLAGADVTESESVAAHSWGTTFLSLLISRFLKEQGVSVNIEQVLSLAVIHDLPEALISDIPSPAVQRGGPDMERGKPEAELNAVQEILTPLGTEGRGLIELWASLEESSIESEIVRVADRLDMLIHTVILQKGGVAEEILLPFRNSVCQYHHSILNPVISSKISGS